MLNLSLAKDELLQRVEKLQKKKNLAGNVEAGYYDPGNMEYLDQYLGLYDKDTNTIRIRTESKGLRYEERTPRLDFLSVGDSVQLTREPTNPFNENNFIIESSNGESLGNLSAELCNAIAPLYDLGYLKITDSRISYIEKIRDRSRYAKQGVLFIEITLSLIGI